jgi:hypothetical protein
LLYCFDGGCWRCCTVLMGDVGVVVLFDGGCGGGVL